MSSSLVVTRRLWPLKAPFRISRGVKTAAETVLVEISRDGATGRGEAVPYARYGETVEGVIAEVDTVAAAVADGASHAESPDLLPAGAARNAVDCALWDLEARLSGVSVAERIGRPPPASMITAVTVSLDTPDAMAAAARAVAASPLLKVKVNAEDPEARIRAVAEAAPDARLIVDPNESWDFALLERLQPLLGELGVALVEQPLPAGQDEALAGFQPSAPICADESAHVTADLRALRGRYQAVNIKLDKTGGLTEALAMLAAARAAGLQVMTGCMVCPSLAVAPALHLASQSDFVDLDGPWWLAQDWPGGVVVRDGRISPPPRGFWASRSRPPRRGAPCRSCGKCARWRPWSAKEPGRAPRRGAPDRPSLRSKRVLTTSPGPPRGRLMHRP